MTNLDRLYEADRAKRLGVTKLDVEPANPRKPIDLRAKPDTDAQYYKRHMAELREKYNLPDGLSVNGVASHPVTTVEDKVREYHVAQAKGMKLCCASVNRGDGSKTRLWFELRE